MSATTPTATYDVRCEPATNLSLSLRANDRVARTVWTVYETLSCGTRRPLTSYRTEEKAAAIAAGHNRRVADSDAWARAMADDDQPCEGAL